MTPENFVYWLQGYLELRREGTTEGHITMSSVQVKIIEDHLKLVFDKKTTDLGYESLNTKFTGLPTNSFC